MQADGRNFGFFKLYVKKLQIHLEIILLFGYNDSV